MGLKTCDVWRSKHIHAGRENAGNALVDQSLIGMTEQLSEQSPRLNNKLGEVEMKT